LQTHRKARLDPIISPLDVFSNGMQVIAVAAISYSNARRLEICVPGQWRFAHVAYR
jgi:hypothetical protein